MSGKFINGRWRETKKELLFDEVWSGMFEEVAKKIATEIDEITHTHKGGATIDPMLGRVVDRPSNRPFTR